MTDTAEKATSHVADHPFSPRPAGWWSLCATCGLSEAAHTAVADGVRYRGMIAPPAKHRGHEEGVPTMDCSACFTEAHA